VYSVWAFARSVLHDIEIPARFPIAPSKFRFIMYRFCVRFAYSNEPQREFAKAASFYRTISDRPFSIKKSFRRFAPENLLPGGFLRRLVLSYRGDLCPIGKSPVFLCIRPVKCKDLYCSRSPVERRTCSLICRNCSPSTG
jgi:hypothetical protein